MLGGGGLSGGGNLTRSDFDHRTFFKAKNNILYILNIELDSPSRENPFIPYIKAKKKKYFYNLEKLKH